jgi:phosphorylcholine metabolism protein LicD
MVSKDAIKQFVNKNIILKNIFDFFLYFYRIYKYLIFEYPKNKRFQKNGEKVLLEVCEILSSNNINYWLDAGTLLGIIRDNKLLKMI